MRIIVCGGRDYDNYERLEEVLNWFVNDISGLAHGCARGADTLAHRWMEENMQSNAERLALAGEPWDIDYQPFQADWDKHGKSAGILRNIEMLKEFKPDLVIAFPGGKGTAHMISYAKENNVSVLEVK